MLQLRYQREDSITGDMKNRHGKVPVEKQERCHQPKSAESGRRSLVVSYYSVSDNSQVSYYPYVPLNKVQMIKKNAILCNICGDDRTFGNPILK